MEIYRLHLAIPLPAQVASSASVSSYFREDISPQLNIFSKTSLEDNFTKHYSTQSICRFVEQEGR